jgi:hypothetical protein
MIQLIALRCDFWKSASIASRWPYGKGATYASRSLQIQMADEQKVRRRCDSASKKTCVPPGRLASVFVSIAVFQVGVLW